MTKRTDADPSLSTKGNRVKHRQLVALAGVSLLSAQSAVAQDKVFKIGLILPMTGQQATTGHPIEAATRLGMAEHGGAASKKGRPIVKDDPSLRYWS